MNRTAYYEEMKALARAKRQEFGIAGPRVLRSDFKRIFKKEGIAFDYWNGPLKAIRGAYLCDDLGPTIMVQVQPAEVLLNMMINEAVHVMLPTFEKPFPRFFRHVARPTSDAVFVRWNSKRDCCVVTVDGTVRPPACEWNWIDQLVVVDMGLAFEITEQDAAAMLLEVAAGGNPWREP